MIKCVSDRMKTILNIMLRRCPDSYRGLEKKSIKQITLRRCAAAKKK